MRHKIRRCDETGDFMAWPITWPKFTACLTDRAKVDDVICGIPGFPSSSASGRRATWSMQVSSTRDAARDARTTTVKTVPRCSSRSVVRLALFNARSVGEKSAAVQQWITDMKLSLAALVETWHDDASSPQLIAWLQVRGECTASQRQLDNVDKSRRRLLVLRAVAGPSSCPSSRRSRSLPRSSTAPVIEYRLPFYLNSDIFVRHQATAQ